MLSIDRSGRLEGLEQALREQAAKPQVAGLLVLACHDNGFAPAVLDPLLGSIGKPLFGGLFPQILQGRERLTRGSIVLGLARAPRLRILKDLSDPRRDLALALEDALDPDGPGRPTLFVFVDGYAKRIAGLIDALFENFGLEANYLGGGAGSLAAGASTPCVFTQNGLLADAAVLAQLDWPAGIGVAHGWTPISEPIKVTRAEHNRLIELNYRPAFEVYREAIAEHSAQPLDAETFFSVATAYPFGIRKMGGEVVVRDPILLGEDGSILCVGEIPQSSLVHILHGDTDSLIAAAGQAQWLSGVALAAQDPSKGALRIFIDCISRVLFLGDDFDRELAVVDDGLPLVGALTLGEIANAGEDFLEFYNKTSVVGLFASAEG
ncbi:hypothetical protein Thiowin_01574 [Thiorhodovibrio winogradskyi]|uniref:Histidine kinase n=1 Tax=Thiorhodovibrio winogradskyi TaxID=77007 RepID=A0ABZ0S6N7_9GAMM|nr:FIST C-terminal domain-containing protein [Thiorhodovibrio winogradskyi]